jgi:hypothetical protein
MSKFDKLVESILNEGTVHNKIPSVDKIKKGDSIWIYDEVYDGEISVNLYKVLNVRTIEKSGMKLFEIKPASSTRIGDFGKHAELDSGTLKERLKDKPKGMK